MASESSSVMLYNQREEPGVRAQSPTLFFFMLKEIGLPFSSTVVIKNFTPSMLSILVNWNLLFSVPTTIYLLNLSMIFIKVFSYYLNIEAGNTREGN